MTTYDVVVVGAGIVGVSTAWELARRGVSVCVLDQGEVAGGTTGLGEGNVLCSDKDTGPELELTLLGMQLFAELEEQLGTQARIRRKGALVVHPDERTWLGERDRVERLQRAGVDARLVGADEVRAMEPQLTGAVHGAVHVPADLQCDPRAITRALAYEAQRLGADVRTGARVGEIVVEHAAAVGARIGREVVRAGAIVLAAGPWSRPLAESAGLPLPLEPRKGQLVGLRMPVPDERFLRHKIVDGSYLLDVLDPTAERRVSTVVETTWDGHVVVGSSRERCGFDPAVDPKLETLIRKRAARLVPALADLRATESWVGFRPWLPDHLPALGESSLVPGLWVATGHEGAGVALGPVTGRLIAGAIGREELPIDLRPFSPDRFS
jgi:glycine/D-amino acid oxidase-like deaminating enzyme